MVPAFYVRSACPWRYREIYWATSGRKL